MTRKNRGLKLIGVPVEPELYEAIVEISRSQGTVNPVPLASVARDLLWKALRAGAGDELIDDLEDQGYQAGVKRGLHEVRQHMKKFFD